ncbi:hypothetical protein HZH68_004251 [Vespula germanica]|uniref:Uncharacterized protein n=1 Tax=Vespula germanica TaxID=30212 RepID=A0A834KNE1_VESGE|nr:hypothetical protein HZH68_004251 [Vespula germanica]
MNDLHGERTRLVLNRRYERACRVSASVRTNLHVSEGRKKDVATSCTRSVGQVIAVKTNVDEGRTGGYLFLGLNREGRSDGGKRRVLEEKEEKRVVVVGGRGGGVVDVEGFGGESETHDYSSEPPSPSPAASLGPFPARWDPVVVVIVVVACTTRRILLGTMSGLNESIFVGLYSEIPFPTKLVRRKKSKRFRVLREKGRPTSHAIGEVFLVGVQNVRGLGGINVMGGSGLPQSSPRIIQLARARDGDIRLSCTRPRQSPYVPVKRYLTPGTSNVPPICVRINYGTH